MNERRQYRRQMVNKNALVLFQEGGPALDCIVLDLTNHGASIQLPLHLYATKWFELSFDNFRSKRQCRLAWQRDDKLGVCFL